MLGRISSRNAGGSNTVVDKIIRYEEQCVQDSWKMRMLYIGDDAWTPEGGEVGDRTIHSDDAETLANPFTPPTSLRRARSTWPNIRRHSPPRDGANPAPPGDHRPDQPGRVDRQLFRARQPERLGP